MIFVTVGTTSFPFIRMRDVVLDIIKKNNNGEKIIYQHGKAPPVISPNVKNFDSLPYPKILYYMKRARVVLCHGGPATIFQAIAAGKKPFVLPRDSRFSEHINNHQVEFTRFMEHKHVVSFAFTHSNDFFTIKKTRSETMSRNPSLIHHLESLSQSIWA